MGEIEELWPQSTEEAADILQAPNCLGRASLRQPYNAEMRPDKTV